MSDLLQSARNDGAEGELCEHDGEVIGLGLQMPKSRPETFPRMFDKLGSTSRAEVVRLIKEVERTSREEWFPTDDFIVHQRHRSSCNGQAGAGALTRARVKQGMPHVKLSGADLYCQINGGRDRGSMLDDGMHALINNGVAPWDMVDNLEFRESNVSIEAKRERSNYRAGECLRVDDEIELAFGLGKGFIGVVAVHYGANYNNLDRDGVAGPCPGSGNHAVGVEAVRVNRGRFEFGEFNSHGKRSGNNGRRWLTWRDHLAQPNKYHAFYLIRAADGNPDDESNPFT